jgi:hypothetical protein
MGQFLWYHMLVLIEQKNLDYSNGLNNQNVPIGLLNLM